MGNSLLTRSTWRMIFAACLALMLATGSASNASAAPSLTYLDSGQWTFNQDCTVRGDILCTTLLYGLQVWNVADPANPVMLSDYYTDTHRAHSLDWEGDLLALTTQDGWLYLLDLVDPGNPQLIGTLSGFGAKPDIALRRDGATRWCYTAGNAAFDLQILDLTDPANPISRGSLDLSGTPNSIAVSGDRLYIGAEYYGLYTVDVSDADTPVLLDSDPLAGTPLYNVFVDGAVAAVASRNNGFTLFSLSNPDNPAPRANVVPSVNAHHDNLRTIELVVDGTALHVITDNAGLLRYDISDLDDPILNGYDPVLINSGNPYLTFEDGHLENGRFYACHWSGINPGVVMINASSGNSEYLGRTAAFDYVRHVDIAQGIVYGCTGQMGVFAHELVSGVDLEPRGNLPVVETWGVFALDNLVYVASTTEGLVIGDFTDPMNPVRRGSLEVGIARGVEVANNIAYVAAYTGGLISVDVSDPDNLLALDTALYEGVTPVMSSVNVSIEGVIAATADRDQGMNLWDIADPEAIVHLSNFPTADRAVDIVLNKVTAYLVVEGVGVHIIDISSPTSPALINTFSSAAEGAELEGSYLHLNVGNNGLATYHLVDPHNPQLLAQYNSTHTGLGSPCVDGNTLYLADRSGILVLDLFTGTPVAVSWFDIGWNGAGVSVDWELDLMSAGSEQRVLARRMDPYGAEAAVLEIEEISPNRYHADDRRATLLAGGEWNYTLESRDPGGEWLPQRSATIALDPLVIATRPQLAAYPNPFNPRTTIRLWGVSEGSGRLDLFNLNGRRVASLHDGPVTGGLLERTWNGRDDKGHKLASGVYLLRWSGEGAVLQEKLILLR